MLFMPHSLLAVEDGVLFQVSDEWQPAWVTVPGMPRDEESRISQAASPSEEIVRKPDRMAWGVPMDEEELRFIRFETRVIPGHPADFSAAKKVRVWVHSGHTLDLGVRAAGFGGAENDPVSILAPERHHHDGDGWQSFEWDVSPAEFAARCLAPLRPTASALQDSETNPKKEQILS
jgi:hypothetical protein